VHDVGGKRELEREQDPSGEFEPDLPSAELVRGAPTTAMIAWDAPSATTTTAPTSMASAM
jgi:hypothetical protein